jgi:uncharacterized oligopeptide transporter (OPT) family protein
MSTTDRVALAEFTARAVVTGVVLGIVFGAASAYLQGPGRRCRVM